MDLLAGVAVGILVGVPFLLLQLRSTQIAISKERRDWKNERKDLLDRLMFMQGHREYAPTPKETPKEEKEETPDQGWRDY